MKIKHLFSGGSKAAKAGLSYTVGNMLIKGLSFLAIPIFSQLMTQENYGLYNTFLSYASILTIFLGFALNASIKNAKYEFPGRLADYCSSTVLLLLINAAVLTALGAALTPALGSVIGLGGGMAVLLVAESFGTAMLTFYNDALAINFRSGEYLVISFCYSAGSILLSVLFIKVVWPENQYLARTLGSIVPLLLIAVYILIRLFRTAAPRVSRTYWKYGLKFSLPLIPHGLSQILLSQFDRIMIQNTVSEAKAGVYSFAFNIAVVFQVVATSADTAWTPWFYEKMAAGQEAEIRSKTRWYVLALALLAMLMMLVCPEVILLMGREKYLESRYSVIPIVLGMFFAFLYFLPSAIEYYYKKTNMISVATCCAAVLNIILNAIFIPLCGYVAAAYTTVACYVLYFIFHLFFARRLLGHFLYDMKHLLFVSLGVSAFSALCVLLVDHFAARMILLAVFFGVCTVTAVRKRNVLVPAMRRIFGKKAGADT